MFDFEKLEVYKKAKDFNIAIYQIIQSNKDWDRTTRDQLRRASFSIQLNIAEGSSRFSKADRKNFFVIARGSIFECVAILDFLISLNLISTELQKKLYMEAEELSKILYTMIRNLEA
jgi:four helix bundle protein